MYPAFYSTVIPGAIAVGATTSTDGIGSFSSHGTYVNLAAPGVNIESTYGDSDTDFLALSGTSFASPYTAAAVAILRGVCPSDTPAQLRTRLEVDRAGPRDPRTRRLLRRRPRAARPGRRRLLTRHAATSITQARRPCSSR